MDVRISYAVNLDKVPEKVVDMLSELEISKAVRMARLATEMIDLGHCEMGAILIEKARQALGKADLGLTETQMILNGYIKAKEEPEAPTIPEPVSKPETTNVD